MKKTVTGTFLLTLFFLMLLFPEEVKSGALDGLFLWYNSVVPILLPFLILSNLIITTDSFSLLLHPFFNLQKRHPAFQPFLFYPVFLGLFCGFPMGAKTIKDLIHSKSLTVKEGNLLLPLVNQASPMFLAGFVGVHILKKQLSFFQILYYLYLPPVICLLFRFLFSFLLSPVKKERNHSKKKVIQSFTKNKNSMPLNLEHTIWNGFYVVVIIGIYMMLFTIAAKLCKKLLPSSQIISVLLCSLEFSSGLDQLASLTFLDSELQIGLILALTSFGGFCTAAQTYTLVKETGISMKSYLFWKLLIAIGVFILYSSSISSS